MNTPEQYQALWEAASLSVSLIGLVVFWKFFWKPTNADVFRHRVFAARRELFLFAMDRGVAPREMPAYVRIRNVLNHSAFHAERLGSGFTFVKLMALWRGRSDDGIDKCLERVTDPEIRQKLQDTLLHISRLLIAHMFLSSVSGLLLIPVMAILVALVSIIELLRSKKDVLNRIFIRLARGLDSEAASDADSLTMGPVPGRVSFFRVDY